MAEKSLLDAGLCIIQNAVPADAIALAAAQAKLVTAEVMAALSGEPWGRISSTSTTLFFKKNRVLKDDIPEHY